MRNIVLTILLVLLCKAAFADVAIPPWTQPVIDLTGTLSPQQTQALNQRLAAFEARKGAQIGVLIVPTTQPETVFQYGMRVFDTWKLGRKGVDDGLLWVISADNGRWHILTGYGLEGVLPDAMVRRVAEESIDPYFNRGEIYTGIEKGVKALMKVVESEPLPPPSIEHASVDCPSVVRPKNALAIPPWTQPVIDLADTLEPGQLGALNKRLKAFEYRKGTQIGMLIVPTTEPENIAQFTMRVCADWKLGRDGVGDGVVMTIDKESKQFYITVGHGLDKVLDNAKLQQILNETIVPNLMIGEFNAGIVGAMDAIMKVVDTIPLPPPDHSSMTSISRRLSPYFDKIFGVFILIAMFVIVVMYRKTKQLKRDESTPD
jgi:uncharacterized membrane protein YgcG